MYAAASAGMTWRTEPPTAPTARVRRMSRRDMDSFMGVPNNGKKKNLTQRAQRAQRSRRRRRNEPDRRGRRRTRRAQRSQSEERFLDSGRQMQPASARNDRF